MRMKQPYDDCHRRVGRPRQVVQSKTVVIARLYRTIYCCLRHVIFPVVSHLRTKDPFSAQLIKVQPTPNNGCAELIPLHHHVYVYDALEKRRFEPVKFPENMPFQFYKEWKGYVIEGELKLVASHLGTNTMEMVISTFAELFQERATAPFFVFQVRNGDFDGILCLLVVFGRVLVLCFVYALYAGHV
ncbi:putative cation-transporting ATPase 13A1 [Trichinella spiralis]|uniref:putative cation-transporting ATPase 13A1 n=1 Tax=Trichinella spiralis TaxID=6334 RepID=UPI0001EFBB28|nr:putative cation-transporting ATPase 13A1 [Trichinella spiralis]